MGGKVKDSFLRAPESARGGGTISVSRKLGGCKLLLVDWKVMVVGSKRTRKVKDKL